MQNFVRFVKEIRQYWRLIALIGWPKVGIMLATVMFTVSTLRLFGRG